MRAKCPECQDGCDKCEGGFIEVGVAVGRVYTRHCNACNFDNGGRIVGPDTPPLSEKPDPCVLCRSEDTEWLLMGENLATITCPRRMHESPPAEYLEGADEWRDGTERWGQSEDSDYLWRWKPRVCSHCDSLHPEDALSLLADGWVPELTDAPHRGRLLPSNHARSPGMGPKPSVLFHRQHFMPDQLAVLDAGLTPIEPV